MTTATTTGAEAYDAILRRLGGTGISIAKWAASERAVANHASDFENRAVADDALDTLTHTLTPRVFDPCATRLADGDCDACGGTGEFPGANDLGPCLHCHGTGHAAVDPADPLRGLSGSCAFWATGLAADMLPRQWSRIRGGWWGGKYPADLDLANRNMHTMVLAGLDLATWYRAVRARLAIKDADSAVLEAE